MKNISKTKVATKYPIKDSRLSFEIQGGESKTVLVRQDDGFRKLSIDILIAKHGISNMNILVNQLLRTTKKEVHSLQLFN